ncbi:DMT family transporter [Arhodomonas sp. AD133]|uniref:DMT family transporter n=1 Tax=Arhodomonas sp. AD133 TaxID=3415009 RepID=UPI003EB9C7BC
MRNPLIQGAALIILSEALLATMSAAIKVVSADLPNEMLVFFRNLFGLLIVLPVALRHGPSALRTSCPHIHLLRAAAGVGAMYCFFYTIEHIPLAEAILFKLTAPFFIPLIALTWLGERIPVSARLAIALGFGGCALVLGPGSEGWALAGITGLAGAFLAGLAKVAIRRMGRSEPAPRVVFYFGVFATTITAIPLTWSWQTPGLVPLGWLLLMGGCATAAQLCLTRAYSLAPAGQIGPFTYVSVVFGSLLGWLFWGEIPGLATVAGSLFIIGAGLLTLHGRHEAARAARATRPVGARP